MQCLPSLFWWGLPLNDKAPCAIYGLKHALLTKCKANQVTGHPCRVTGDCRDGVTAPNLGDGFIARVTLPVFCRGKERKHNFHEATQRMRFQFNSEVTSGTHASCGPLARDCSWLM